MEAEIKTVLIIAVFCALFYGVLDILLSPGTLVERIKNNIKPMLILGLFFGILVLISLSLGALVGNGGHITDEDRERYDRAFHNR